MLFLKKIFSVKAICLICMLLTTTGIFAGVNPPDNYSETVVPHVSGDNPPTPLFQYSGQGDIAFAVTGSGDSGTFDLTSLPDDATVEAAFFITGVWFPPDNGETYTINFIFHSIMEEVSATSFDESTNGPFDYDLGGFAIDVTSEITGNGSYLFSCDPIEPGSAGEKILAVIYSAPWLPNRTLQLLAGAESLEYGASTAQFDLSGDGSGRLLVSPISGNSGHSSGEESIMFNGELIDGGVGSSLFDGNVIIFDYPVTLQNGSNSVTVTTGQDWIGWCFAALVGPVGTVETEQSSWGQVKTYYR